MNRKIAIGLGAAIAFQFCVLTGMYLAAQLPLWTGTEIRLKTIPVDPRDLFRGNYARLEYEISLLDSAQFPAQEGIRNGEVVYITLEPGEGGLHRLSGVSLHKPPEGSYLRGRIAGRWFEAGRGQLRVRYGIEAFFAPKARALELEDELRDGGVAVLMVSPGGRARLKAVRAPGK